MAVDWEVNMSTGLVDIDDEHREWLRRFNEFEQAVTGEYSKEHMQAALRFFEIYTKFHFDHEEDRIIHKHSPAAEKNRREHEIITAKIKDLKNRIYQAGVGMVEVMELKVDMECWLEDHICDTDVELFTGERSGA